MITRPLLASPVKDFTKIKFPVLASKKLDGIRAIMVDGKLVSRNFKPIPNVYAREMLEKVLPNGFDGELLLDDPTAPFNEVSSAIMSRDGEPNFSYAAFDYVKDALDKPYQQRMEDLANWNSQESSSPEESEVRKRVKILMPVVINNIDELRAFELECIQNGYEGVMIRSPQGSYKCGRSTEKEGILLKVKQFEDDEAIVIGFEEKMHNINEKVEDAFGLAKRSSEKEGMVPAGTLGTIIVRCNNFPTEFGIGSGFDDATRKMIWENRDQYLGKKVVFTYQPHGVKDSPRFPVFKGIRHENDMSV